jgi:hypothetical protein
MPTGYLKSKSGCRRSEPRIFHAVTFFVRDEHPSLWNRRLRHLSQNILSQVLAQLRSTSWQLLLLSKKFFRENWGWENSRGTGPSLLEGCSKLRACWGSKNVKDFQKPETNDFDGIAIGDESWFQRTISSSKMFASSAVGVLHRKETYRVRCSSKRSHIQSYIFYQEHIPRFENSEPELSTPENRVNLLGTHG